MLSLTSPRHISTLPIPAGRNAQIALKTLLDRPAAGDDSLVLGAGDSVDDGRTAGDARGVLYGFSLERHVKKFRLAEIGESCMRELQRGAPRLADVIPMRGKNVVDKLSRGLAEAEGKCTRTRKLSGN